MIKSNKNSVLIIAYEQGKIFKELKTDNKFINAVSVSAFKISKTTINFEIDIVKLIDMYPKMQTSCISLNYLKNYFRVIKKSVKNMLLNLNNILLTNILIILKLRKRVVLIYCKTKV